MITLIVLGWLSLYFIVSISILISRSFYLSRRVAQEKSSLNAMLMGAKNVAANSVLRQCSSGSNVNPKLLSVCLKMAEKDASGGLSWLSIIASTSPFIGLFGTVVSILETFSGLGNSSSASLGVIAPAISEALVATASGIFVAIPAYTFYNIIKRQGYNLMNLCHRQVDIMESSLSQKEVPKQDNAD